MHELFAVWGERRAGRGCARSRRSSATTWSGPGATGRAGRRRPAQPAPAAPRPPIRARPAARPWAGGDLPVAVQAAGAGRRPAPRGRPGRPGAAGRAGRRSATGEFHRAEAADQAAAAAAGQGRRAPGRPRPRGPAADGGGGGQRPGRRRLQRETSRAIATFAEFEDQRGLAKAWGLLAALGFPRCRIAEAEAAAGQAITHARLARDDPSESWARGCSPRAPSGARSRPSTGSAAARSCWSRPPATAARS